MRKRSLIQEIASVMTAIENCRAHGNTEWLATHRAELTKLVAELPSGAGIDNGTKLDQDRSNGNRIVLTLGFHHMNEHGVYDGWTEHEIWVTPAFDGVNLRITGKNRNDIKSYLYELYDDILTRTEE